MQLMQARLQENQRPSMKETAQQVHALENPVQHIKMEKHHANKIIKVKPNYIKLSVQEEKPKKSFSFLIS